MTTEPVTAAPAAEPVDGGRRRVEWWHLGWLGIMLFQPVFNPGTETFEWVVLGATWAVYIPLYIVGELGNARTRWWTTVATVALGIAVVPVNGGASVLFVFAAAFLGSVFSRDRAVRWLAGLSVVLGVLAFLSEIPIGYAAISFLPSLLMIWIIGFAVIAECEQQREAAQLRIDNARIEHLATVTERERIARDLHDVLGHTLTSVVVRAQLVQRLAAQDPVRAAGEGAAIEAAAREALGEVRGTVRGWRQASLDDELTAARAALAAAGVVLEVERRDELALAPSVEGALALALREAVTNVVRHADARHCTIDFARTDGEVILCVRDDGRGGGQEGGGLAGMRERIAGLGGRVERAVQPSTAVTVAVPVEVAG